MEIVSLAFQIYLCNKLKWQCQVSNKSTSCLIKFKFNLSGKLINKLVQTSIMRQTGSLTIAFAYDLSGQAGNFSLRRAGNILSIGSIGERKLISRDMRARITLNRNALRVGSATTCPSLSCMHITYEKQKWKNIFVHDTCTHELFTNPMCKISIKA